MAAFHSDIPSSPVAQVGDNFDTVELHRPAVAPPLVPDACSIEERGEESDTESGSYKRRRIEGERSDAVGRGGDDEEAVDEPDAGLTWASSERVKRRKTRKHEGGCAHGGEVVNTREANLTWTSKQVEGRQRKQHEKGLAEERKDTREEDRAFWELCLAYGYP